MHCISGVQLILGLNGVIWVTADTKQPPEQAESSLVSDAQPAVSRDITVPERQAIARVANSIRALAKLYFSIHPTSIMDVYMVSLTARKSSATAGSSYPGTSLSCKASVIAGHFKLPRHVVARQTGLCNQQLLPGFSNCLTVILHFDSIALCSHGHQECIVESANSHNDTSAWTPDF